MPRGKFDLTNQKYYPGLGSDASSVWKRSFVRRHLVGKPVVASPNVGSFLRLAKVGRSSAKAKYPATQCPTLHYTDFSLT